MLDGLLGLLSKIFPTKKQSDKEISISDLKEQLAEMSVATEAIEQLRTGVLMDFRDIS